jgi:hypothetical protein
VRALRTRLPSLRELERRINLLQISLINTSRLVGTDLARFPQERFWPRVESAIKFRKVRSSAGRSRACLCCEYLVSGIADEAPVKSWIPKPVAQRSLCGPPAPA